MKHTESSINHKEVRKFEEMSEDWWNPGGMLRTLHEINFARVQYIVDTIKNKFSLKDLDILDVGCGGGLVCEPIARLGAKVTGVDASEVNISIAKEHAQKSKLDINYLNCEIQDLVKEKKKYSVVVCLEVVEHVDNVEEFIQSCCKLLKKGGLVFFSTINRNVKSYTKAILAAEYVLRLLPIGTHDWKKFMKPSEIEAVLSNSNVQLEKVKGLEYSFLGSSKWKISDNIDVNYILHGKKN